MQRPRLLGSRTLRFAIGFALAIAAITIAAFTLVYLEVAREETNRLGAILTEEARLNVDASQERLRAALAARQLSEIRRIDYLALFDANGVALLGNLMRLPPIAIDGLPHVLDGVVLDGAAARLAGMLDRALLDEAGWDPGKRILFLPAGHRLLGREVCRAERCGGTVHNDCPGVCYRCFTRLQRLGMSAVGIAAAEYLPAASVPAGWARWCTCSPTAECRWQRRSSSGS